MRFLLMVTVVPVAVQIPVTIPVLAPLLLIAAPNNPEMVLPVMLCVPNVPVKIPPITAVFAEVLGGGIFRMLLMVLLALTANCLLLKWELDFGRAIPFFQLFQTDGSMP